MLKPYSIGCANDAVASSWDGSHNGAAGPQTQLPDWFYLPICFKVRSQNLAPCTPLLAHSVVNRGAERTLTVKMVYILTSFLSASLTIS
jgi:hypothetical protein